MREFVLVGDSTADLPADIVNKYGIKILPFSYSINDEVFNYSMSGDEAMITDFYARLKKGAMPVTSQINPNTYKEYFEEILKTGKDVLYVCFTSGLSGSYQTACLAASMLEEKYPDNKVTIVDSYCASIGEGVFLYLVADLMEQGKSMDELVEWMEANRHNISHWFMVEDLFHLKRGGRVSTVEAMVGTALKIKPILSVDEEGKLVVKSKARGTNKALEYIVSKLKEEGGDFSTLKIVIGHADAIEKANKLKEEAIAVGVKPENILVSSIGPVIGSHVGAGMAAMAFLNNVTK